MGYKKYFSALVLLLLSKSLFGMGTSNFLVLNAINQQAMIRAHVRASNMHDRAILQENFVQNPLLELENNDKVKKELLQELYLDAIKRIELIKIKKNKSMSMEAHKTYLESFLNSITFGCFDACEEEDCNEKISLDRENYNQLLSFQRLCRIHAIYRSTGHTEELDDLIKNIDFSTLNVQQQAILAEITKNLHTELEAKLDVKKIKKLKNINFSFK